VTQASEKQENRLKRSPNYPKTGQFSKIDQNWPKTGVLAMSGTLKMGVLHPRLAKITAQKNQKNKIRNSKQIQIPMLKVNNRLFAPLPAPLAVAGQTGDFLKMAILTEPPF
jgi:hypothetical protein